MPTPNNLVTRFPNGIVNVLDNDIFANLSLEDRTKLHTFQDDFDIFLATLWNVGGLNTPTRQQQAGDGGLLQIATSAANNDNSWVQTGNSFTQVATNPTKRIFFRCRAQVDNATLSGLAMGLQVTVTGNNILTPANGIFFRKDLATANMFIVSRAASVETVSAALGAIVANQQFEVAFATDLVTNQVLAAFQANTANGPAQVVAGITPAAFPTVTMGAMMGVQAGSAATRTALFDYIMAAKER